jgi:hypothetical protein
MGLVPQFDKDGWYLLHGDKPHGPFPISAFLEAVEEGTLTKDHLVWRPGWSAWRQGAAAAELLTDTPTEDAVAEFSEVPPPPPLPATPAAAEASTAPAENRLSRLIRAARPARDNAHIEARSVAPANMDAANMDAVSAAIEQHLAANSEDHLDPGASFEPNYFLRHWRGELNLPTSYWINTLIAVAVIGSSIFALRILLQNAGSQSSLVALTAWGVFCVLVLAVVTWQFVGLWRSASYHPERGGSIFWARAAQVMVVIGASAGIITWLADSARFAVSSTLTESATTQRVKESLIKVPVYATLQRVAPSKFDSLSAQVADEFPQNATDEAIFSAARSALAQTVRLYTPRASDEAILEMADVLIAYMNALREADPESCVAINDPSKGARLRANLLKQYPNLFDRELAADEKILATGSDNAQSVPAESQVASQLATIQTQMTQHFDRQLGLLSKPALKPSEYSTFCQIALALFEEIRGLPQKEAVDLLRYVYAQT